MDHKHFEMWNVSWRCRRERGWGSCQEPQFSSWMNPKSTVWVWVVRLTGDTEGRVPVLSVGVRLRSPFQLWRSSGPSSGSTVSPTFPCFAEGLGPRVLRRSTRFLRKSTSFLWDSGPLSPSPRGPSSTCSSPFRVKTFLNHTVNRTPLYLSLRNFPKVDPSIN